MLRDHLTNELNSILKPENYKDYCPNGLQVEGKKEIKKIITGVSACVDLFEKAIEMKADGIIVHHGLIWNFERPVYKGAYKTRVKLLLENDINLWGYHLPLDANENYGNNIQIAEKLGLKNIEPFGEYNGILIGYKGICDQIQSKQFFEKIKTIINDRCIIFPYGPEKINSVGIISGGAQKEFKQAISDNIDLYITGEVSEYNLHMAKEEGVHFVAAGHHATERFGIQALGDYLGEKCDLDIQYIDIPNPV